MKKNKPKYKQIIDAAVIVIANYGYHEAKVSKIAQEAGIADGTIYLYFKNKEDILVSMFQDKMGEFIEKIEKEIAGKMSAVEKLLTMIEMHFKLLARDRHLAIVTQIEIRQANKELRTQIGEVLKGYLNIIDGIIKSGIEEGDFNPKLDIRLARQMVFGTIDEVTSNWVIKEQKYDLQSLSGPVHNMLISGLSAK